MYKVCILHDPSPPWYLCACKQYVQCVQVSTVLVDYVPFIPPPPFFDGTRAEFDTTLKDCWYWCILLLFRVQVKLDKEDGDGRSFRMDCDCTMIECLYDFAPAGVHALGVILVCIKSALCLQ